MLAQDKPLKIGVTGGPHAQILEQVKKINGVAENDDERNWLRELHLLSDKPVLYVANVAEDDANQDVFDTCMKARGWVLKKKK